LTFPARGFTQRRLGSAPREEQYAHPERRDGSRRGGPTAVDAGLPLLLSTEAAGQLKDTVRVGRMKGRPGMLTITTSDGVSATTRRLVAEQALSDQSPWRLRHPRGYEIGVATLDGSRARRDDRARRALTPISLWCS